MYHIYTKRVRKIWYCYATIKGYDHSFTGNSLESSQNQMKEMLERKQIKTGECFWYLAEQINEPPKQKHLGGITRPPRIDHL